MRKYHNTFQWKKLALGLKDCDLSQVTLATNAFEDGGRFDDLVKVKAHKAILASSSQILRRLLASEDDLKMIYLRGVRGSVLEVILEYIYRGRVDLEEDQVEDFLRLAFDLKIEGLMADQFVSNRVKVDKAINGSNTDDIIRGLIKSGIGVTFISNDLEFERQDNEVKEINPKPKVNKTKYDLKEEIFVDLIRFDEVNGGRGDVKGQGQIGEKVNDERRFFEVKTLKGDDDLKEEIWIHLNRCDLDLDKGFEVEICRISD